MCNTRNQLSHRHGGTLPFDPTDERLAAAAWSRLAEPGDEAAGILRRHLGPSAALQWLHQHLTTTARVTASDASRPAGPGPDGGGHGWQQAVARWLPRLASLDIRREVEALNELGGRLVLPGEQEWPAGLNDLGDAAPAALWVRGQRLEPSAKNGVVAIVGARAATSYGETLAAEHAIALARHGLLVVSGGAYGIDAAAHRGALSLGAPTWAFLAGGIDRLYPAGNSQLLESIIDSGAVISELPPGSAPTRNRFLQRNRLIAAVSRGCLVVEAAWRSGALNTAGHATELLRPLGAVPGPVTSMTSVGCHRLIRHGTAICVTSGEEMLELISAAGEHLETDRPVQPGLLDNLDPLAAQVLDALPARGAAGMGSIVKASGRAPEEVRAALGHLELAGKAQRHGADWRRATRQ